MLCANKVDLAPELWQIKREEYQQFADKMGVMVIECSASTGQNVQEIFVELGRQVLQTHRAELPQVRDDQDGASGRSVILADFAERRRRKERGACCGGSKS